MEKHYPSYFKSTPPPYKLTLLFLPKKFILPPIKSHLKIFIPPLLRVGGGGGGEWEGANYGFRYRNKYPPLHFIFTPPPILRVLLRSSPKAILLWPPQFMKIWKNTLPPIPPLLILRPTTIKHKRLINSSILQGIFSSVSKY